MWVRVDPRIIIIMGASDLLDGCRPRGCASRARPRPCPSLRERELPQQRCELWLGAQGRQARVPEGKDQ